MSVRGHRARARDRRDARIRSVGPLRNRDFRLLFAGRCISLLGDGAFLVAMAWEAYTISDAPTALSLLGIAMTVPLVTLLLVGGVVSDRHDRRRVMLCADLVRAAGGENVADDCFLQRPEVVEAEIGLQRRSRIRIEERHGARSFGGRRRSHPQREERSHAPLIATSVTPRKRTD